MDATAKLAWLDVSRDRVAIYPVVPKRRNEKSHQILGILVDGAARHRLCTPLALPYTRITEALHE